MYARANALTEVDDLAPINARINPPHRAALRALEVGGNVPPIPIRKIGEHKPAHVVAAAMIAFGRIRQAQAMDSDRLEAGIPIDRTRPVFKVMSGLSTPRHPLKNACVGNESNYRFLGARSASEILPVVGVEESRSRGGGNGRTAARRSRAETNLPEARNTTEPDPG